MTLDQLTEIVNSPVALALLLLVFVWIIGKGGWVPGTTHRTAVERERERADEVGERERARGDEWKEIATGVTRMADRAVARLEKES